MEPVGMKKLSSAASNGWYLRTNDAGQTFYTPLRDSKMEWIYTGNGETLPTPKELAERANELGTHSAYDFNTFGLIRKDTTTDISGDSVELPSGTYTYHSAAGRIVEHLRPFDLRNDIYVHMPSVYGKITKDIQDFIAAEEIYRDMGILYRRGLFLFGPPGNGKTALIRDVIKNELPNDTVCIFLDQLPSDGFLATIKTTLSSRVKIFIFEEMATVLASSRRQEAILDFLDGERSIDKSVIIATTNYPELIPGNIVDRPSRFDKLYRIDHPNPELRRLILTHFLGEVTQRIVDDTDGLSIAALKEIAILVKIRKGNLTVSGAVDALKRHHNIVKTEFRKEASIGIACQPFDPNDFDE